MLSSASQRAEVIASVYQNHAADLQTGTSDPDAVIPKMKAEMEAVGTNELIADIQECLDRHLALSSEPDYP